MITEIENPNNESQDSWTKLGERLREAREHAGFRQEDAARLLGISRPTLSSFEAGRTKVDSLMLNRMAVLFRQDVDFFLWGANSHIE